MQLFQVLFHTLYEIPGQMERAVFARSQYGKQDT